MAKSILPLAHFWCTLFGEEHGALPLVRAAVYVIGEEVTVNDANQTHFARSATTVPVGRVVQPEGVAQAQVFLIQDSFMRGTILDCVGGARIK